MKNVLITGGTGFIGRRLARRLQQNIGSNGRVLALGSADVDLTNNNATFGFFERIAKETPFDHVFHLAALYKAGDWPVHHPATQFYDNMSINVNLIEAWRRYLPGARLTSILSYCMYPPTETPHEETELKGTEPEDYLFAYAETKKAMLIAHRAYKQEYGLDCNAAILPTVYGPDDSFEEDSHVMGALIGKFVRAAKQGHDQVEVWGDGMQEREFLFVDDAAEGIITVGQRSTLDVVNIGTGEAHTIRSIVDQISAISGYTGDVVQNESKFVGVRKRLLDISRARKHLGWRAGTSIESGIRQTVDWYRQKLEMDVSAG